LIIHSTFITNSGIVPEKQDDVNRLPVLYVGSITLENGKRKYFYSKKRQEVYEKMNTALQEKKQGTLVTTHQ
jgi:hypothetical protein